MSHQEGRLHTQAALASLMGSGAQAASVASRDGLPVLSVWEIGASEDLFVAMAAAMYGAADACMQESGQESPSKISVSGDTPFEVHRVDDDYLLIVLGQADEEHVNKVKAALAHA